MTEILGQCDVTLSSLVAWKCYGVSFSQSLVPAAIENWKTETTVARQRESSI